MSAAECSRAGTPPPLHRVAVSSVVARRERATTCQEPGLRALLLGRPCSGRLCSSARFQPVEARKVKRSEKHFGVDLPAKVEPRRPVPKHRLCVVLVCHHAALVVVALNSIAEDLNFQVAVVWWKPISWAVHLPARLPFAPADRDQFARIVVIVGSDEGADWVFAATVVVDLENPDLLPRSVLYPGRLDVLGEGERHPV